VDSVAENEPDLVVEEILVLDAARAG